MRAFLLFPVVALAACASTPTAKDLEKMSTLDACYLGIVEPDIKPLVDAEMQRRKANCQDHEAELKKMADQELRAGGQGPSGTEAAKSAAQPGGMGGGGMGRY